MFELSFKEIFMTWLSSAVILFFVLSNMPPIIKVYFKDGRFISDYIPKEFKAYSLKGGEYRPLYITKHFYRDGMPGMSEEILITYRGKIIFKYIPKRGVIVEIYCNKNSCNPVVTGGGVDMVVFLLGFIVQLSHIK